MFIFFFLQYNLTEIHKKTNFIGSTPIRIVSYIPSQKYYKSKYERYRSGLRCISPASPSSCYNYLTACRSISIRSMSVIPNLFSAHNSSFSQTACIAPFSSPLFPQIGTYINQTITATLFLFRFSCGSALFCFTFLFIASSYNKIAESDSHNNMDSHNPASIFTLLCIINSTISFSL